MSDIAGPMARGQKRKYAEDASTSQEELLPSTTPMLSTTLDLARQPSTSSQAPEAWKKPPGDPRELLDLNVDQFHPSSRATTAITSIFHERFMGGYCTWSQDAWEDRASIRMKDLMGDIRKDYKPVGSISFIESLAKKELEELYKHHSKEEGFYLRRLLSISEGVRSKRIYKAGSEAVHFKAESSRASSYRRLAPIGPCYANMLRRVEAAISSISMAFDEYMRRFTDQNHLVYIFHRISRYSCQHSHF
ncbi:hypothetical protein M9H77_09061 [Catharanthus roseus]|uniref:Uncharacterized protein n=1 Tax=Catharanthus roseus TaxID=4058 RepID=A0ACC0BZP9_CATRO|nr:hypothetical protein M9H77_09061 [Catharanthus roseus]